jgi:hypothetical protein
MGIIFPWLLAGRAGKPTALRRTVTLNSRADAANKDV